MSGTESDRGRVPEDATTFPGNSEDGTVLTSSAQPESSQSLTEPAQSSALIGRLRGRLAEWVALGVIIGLVALGSWNWSGEVGPPVELTEADLRTLEMLRTLRDVDVDVDLMMTSESPERWILDRGFDAPEEDATWMTAREAILEFRPTTRTARAIHLFVYPFVSDSVPRRVLSVETSEGSVEAELGGGGQVVSVALDGELDEQTVTLRCDAIDSPADLGLGPDIRPLCLKLISVRLSS